MHHERGMIVIGERLRLLRRQRGWTQQELADLSGYSDRLIRKAEHGGPVSAASLQVLATTLSHPARVVTSQELQASSYFSMGVFKEVLDPSRGFVESGVRDCCSDEPIIDASHVINSLPLHGKFFGRAAFTDWFRSLNVLIDIGSVETTDYLALSDRADGFIHFRGTAQNMSSEDRVSPMIEFEINVRVKLRNYRIDEMILLSDLKPLHPLSEKWLMLIRKERRRDRSLAHVR